MCPFIPLLPYLSLLPTRDKQGGVSWAAPLCLHSPQASPSSHQNPGGPQHILNSELEVMPWRKREKR